MSESFILTPTLRQAPFSARYYIFSLNCTRQACSFSRFGDMPEAYYPMIESSSARIALSERNENITKRTNEIHRAIAREAEW